MHAANTLQAAPGLRDACGLGLGIGIGLGPGLGLGITCVCVTYAAVAFLCIRQQVTPVCVNPLRLLLGCPNRNPNPNPSPSPSLLYPNEVAPVCVTLFADAFVQRHFRLDAVVALVGWGWGWG